ncbi:putative ankyrin repeat protein [Trichoderma austrokoningii]
MSTPSNVRANSNPFDALPNELLEMIIHNAIKTPFDSASRRYAAKTFNYIAQTCKCLFVVGNPILYKFDVKQGNCSGLFWAARKNKLDIFKRFLDFGAPINTMVATHTVASTALLLESTDILRYLVARPDVDWEACALRFNEPAISMAMRCPPEIRELVLNCEHVAVDAESRDGSTALFRAAERNYVPEAEILLRRGARPDHRDHQGLSPLYLAAIHGSADVLRLLVETGSVDVNIKPHGRPLPLAKATYKGHQAVFDILIAHPDIDAKAVLGSYYLVKRMARVPPLLHERLLLKIESEIEWEPEIEWEDGTEREDETDSE